MHRSGRSVEIEKTSIEYFNEEKSVLKSKGSNEICFLLFSFCFHC